MNKLKNYVSDILVLIIYIFFILAPILLCVVIFFNSREIIRLHEQINEIRFIKEYEEFVKEDYERQVND